MGSTIRDLEERLSKSTAYPPVVAGRRRPHILIVEDDPDLVHGLSTALSQEYDVAVAGDAPSALERLAGQPFDLLLLDLILPKGTGFEVLAALAQQPEAAPPVLVMSALASDVDLSQFRPLVGGVLCKPFGLTTMKDGVRALLAGKAMGEPPHRAPTGSILLVDDDQEFLAGMADYLRKEGYRVLESTSALGAVDLLGHERFDAVVTDWIMPEMTGIDLLKRIKSSSPQTLVLLLTAYATPDLVRTAMSLGAADVLVKPFPPVALPVALQKCLHQPLATAAPAATARPRPSRVERTVAGQSVRYSLDDILGASPQIERAKEVLVRVAPLESNALILGETGTGKELFAQSLHELSPRSEGPFVAVNAAAIPENLLESELFGYAAGAFTGARKEGYKGKFLQADGGTLFLDEIGDLPLSLQAKLLRVLQEGEVEVVGGGSRRVSVRVVAATHCDVEAMIAERSFRADLFYRLNVFTIQLPPLRERPEDVPLLAQRFLAELESRYNRRPVTIDQEALELLASYEWPGNVRELRNVVERAFALAEGDRITADDIPLPVFAPRGRAAWPQPAPTLRSAVDRLEVQEREAILRALDATGGNKLRAAKLLGISRAGLYIKLRLHGLT